MNRGSAKHSAEESPNKATTSKKVFLRPNGLMLMRTIVNMVIISTGYASPEGVKSAEAPACSFVSATRHQLAKVAITVLMKTTAAALRAQFN